MLSRAAVSCRSPEKEIGRHSHALPDYVDRKKEIEVAQAAKPPSRPTTGPKGQRESHFAVQLH
jgi:hypothetical protein